MSKFSGKCDVYDSFGDLDEKALKNTDFYLGDNPVPLRIETQHDLAPYYPYLTAIMSWSKDHRRRFCVLGERSFIDAEEEEHLGWRLRDLKKYYRRCKRNKIAYIVDEALAKVCLFPPRDSELELAKRVEMYGDKATLEGVHDEMHEYYRNALLKEMIRLGWNERKAKYWIWKDWRMLIDGKD